MYDQINGIAMGSLLTPVTAKLFLGNYKKYSLVTIKALLSTSGNKTLMILIDLPTTDTRFPSFLISQNVHNV